MTSGSHEMLCTELEDGIAVFTCLEASCGKQLALDLASGRRRTLVEGDFYALHRGAIGLDLSGSLG